MCLGYWESGGKIITVKGRKLVESQEGLGVKACLALTFDF